MTALDKTPENPNFLQPVDFQMFVKKLPTTNFFVQGVKIPGLAIGETSMPTPLTRIYESGDHIEYDELYVRFKVDEDLKNWLEIHAWLRGLGFPESYDEYKELSSRPKSDLGEGLVSDVSIGVLNSKRLLNFSFVFQDAFPTSLTGFDLDVDSDSATRYVTATAVFRYTLFEVERVPSTS